MMKKLLLALALTIASAPAWAQCTGVFPAKTLCGNLGATAAPPSAFSASGTVVGPASSTIGHFATWGNITGTLLADFDLYGAANAWTGTNTFGAASTFNANANFTSTFQISGATKTFPAGAATLAGLGTNQTFTGNNTFSTGTDNFTGTFQIGGVTVTLPVSAPNGGTGVASPATHTIPINQGASAQANTGTGTTGQCINSAGASADPAFTSGCWVLLNTLTASNSATLSDTTSLTGTYAAYEIVLTNLVPATDTTVCELQVHSGGTFPATSYIAGGMTANTGGVAQTGALTSFIPCTMTGRAHNATPGVNGVFRIQNPSQTTAPKMVTWSGGYYDSAPGYGTFVGSGFWNGGNGAVDGFQILFGAGNITSGTVKVYGRL